MNDRNMNSEELERKLRAYFRAEEEILEAPSDMWERLSPRLSEQERRRRLFLFPFPLPVLRWGRAYVYLATVLGMVVLGAIAWGIFNLVGGGGTPLAPERSDLGGGVATSTPTPTTGPTATTTPVPRPAATPTPTQTPASRIGQTPTPTQAPGETPGPGPTPYPDPHGLHPGTPVWKFGETRNEASNVEVQMGRVVIYEGRYAVLFYVVVAPPEMEGRELLPRDMQVVGDTGTSYPVIDSKALVTVGRLTLGALSFSLEDQPQPSSLAVQIDGFISPSPGGYGGPVIEDAWRFDPLLERADVWYPQGKTLNLRAVDCAVAGDAGVALDEWQRCEPFEVSPTPVPPPPGIVTPTPKPPATPTPTPYAYSQPGATPTPTRSQPWPPVTPTPTSTPYPILAPIPTPKPTPTPYPAGFPTPTAVPTPTLARVPVSTYSVTFKVYNAQSGPDVPYYCLNVLVSREGTVSVIRFAPVENPDAGCPSPR